MNVPSIFDRSHITSFMLQEMHKSSGKHMPDSSDEYKIESDASSDSDAARRRRTKPDELADEDKRRALSDLIKKTAVVPLEKLSEELTKAKTEELQAHLSECSKDLLRFFFPIRLWFNVINRTFSYCTKHSTF